MDPVSLFEFMCMDWDELPRSEFFCVHCGHHEELCHLPDDIDPLDCLECGGQMAKSYKA